MACNLCTSYGCFLKGITWISVRCFHRLNASKSCHRGWWLPLWTPDLNRWKRPFKPRIRPEKDHTRLVGICQNWEPTWIIWSLGSQFTPSPVSPRYPDDDPRRSRPYFAKYALMASSWALRCQGWMRWDAADATPRPKNSAGSPATNWRTFSGHLPSFRYLKDSKKHVSF